MFGPLQFVGVLDAAAEVVPPIPGGARLSVMRSCGILVLFAGVALTQCYLDPPSSLSRIAAFLRAPTATPITAQPPVSSNVVPSQEQTGLAHKDSVGLPKAIVVSLSFNAPVFQAARLTVDPVGSSHRTGAVNLLQPKDPLARYNLVVEMQRRLRSLGCYWGRIDGSWGSGSKAAMNAFLGRVNARTSTDQPNAVLLTLLRSQGAITCGGCPDGDMLTQGGSCVRPATRPDRNPRDAQLVASVLSLTPNNTGQFLVDPSRPNAPVLVEPSSIQGRLSLGGPPPLPQPADHGDYPNDRQLGIAGLESSKQIATERRQSIRSRPVHSKARKQTRRGDPIRQNLLLSLGGYF